MTPRPRSCEDGQHGRLALAALPLFGDPELFANAAAAAPKDELRQRGNGR
jgi:hypothetical protein